jgi:DNA-binding NtrC family response regulator
MFYRHVGEGPVTVGDVPEDERPQGEAARGEWQSAQLDDLVRRALAVGVGLKEIGRVAEEVAIKVAVQEEEGNLQRAAARLGVTDRALQMRRAQRKQLD